MRVLVRGLAVGVALGFLDAVLALLSGSTEFPWVFLLAPAVLAMAVASLAAYAATLAVVRRVAPGALSGDGLAFTAAAAAGLVCVAMAVRFPELVGASSALRPGVAAAPYRAVLVPVLVASAIALVAGAHRLASGLAAAMGPARLSAWGLAVPLFLAEAAVLLWWKTAIPGADVVSIAFAGVAFAAALTAICSGARGLTRARAAFALLVVVLVVAAAARQRLVARLLTRTSSGTHRLRRIVLVTVDTLRADALSCYGSQTPTPNIAALAAEGILFRNAYAPAPWTLPSLASTMTGLSPWVHRYQDVGTGARGPFDVFPNLAQRLRAAGYVTAAYVANPIIPPGNTISDGFDEYHVATYGHDRSLGGQLLRREPPLWLSPDESARVLTQRVLPWIGRNRRNDFFLWVHYFDPHEPYRPPLDLMPGGDPRPVRFQGVTDQADLRWLQKLYAGEVRCVDESVGKLVSGLKARGLYDDTLIVFTSDHGEEFLEHGRFSHGFQLYDETIRVPLLIHPPKGAAGLEVSRPVSTTGLPATVLALAGLAVDASALSTGSAPLWTPRGDGNPAPVLSTGVFGAEEMETVVAGRTKYIRSLASGREELYDLEKDPGERHPVPEQLPAVVENARHLLQAQADEAKRLSRRIGRKRPDTAVRDTVRDLRALGYLQ